MGLIVENYTTKWGIPVNAYISVGRADFGFAPTQGSVLPGGYMHPHVDPDKANGNQPPYSPDPIPLPKGNLWRMHVNARVYRSKEARDLDMNDYMDTIPLVIDYMSAEALSNDTIFGVIYTELKKMFPNGIQD